VEDIWNREELYAEVWEKPLVKVAAKIRTASQTHARENSDPRVEIRRISISPPLHSLEACSIGVSLFPAL
jgi:hypothetical protein